MDIAKIEEKLDKSVAGATEVSMALGGIRFQSMMEVFEMAKMMAISGTAIPKHLRGNPGACLAVCVQALEWHMSPFSVAQKSYEVNDRIAYEAQLIVAVINARAPLKERLRYDYDGEGTDMRCTVSGLIEGEAKPLVYISPKIKDIKVKNSPLWTSDPQQQLAFYSGRAWARRHCPETILGIYADDEMRDAEPLATDITPSVGERLKSGKGKRGFDADNVNKALEHKPETPLNVVTDPKPEAEKAVLQSTSAAPAPAAEVQMELGAGDVETEIAAKKRAIDNVDNKADFETIVAEVQAFLRQHKRPDLIADFLSYADKRGKKLAK